MLVDTHCHANLYLVLEEILKEAKEAGVTKIISVSMSATSQERNLELAKKFDTVYPALGIHPEEIKENPYEVDEVKNLSKKEVLKEWKENKKNYTIWFNKAVELLEKEKFFE